MQSCMDEHKSIFVIDDQKSYLWEINSRSHRQRQTVRMIFGLTVSIMVWTAHSSRCHGPAIRPLCSLIAAKE